MGRQETEDMKKRKMGNKDEETEQKKSKLRDEARKNKERGQKLHKEKQQGKRVETDRLTKGERKVETATEGSMHKSQMAASLFALNAVSPEGSES